MLHRNSTFDWKSLLRNTWFVSIVGGAIGTISLNKLAEYAVNYISSGVSAGGSIVGDFVRSRIYARVSLDRSIVMISDVHYIALTSIAFFMLLSVMALIISKNIVDVSYALDKEEKLLKADHHPQESILRGDLPGGEEDEKFFTLLRQKPLFRINRFLYAPMKSSFGYISVISVVFGLIFLLYFQVFIDQRVSRIAINVENSLRRLESSLTADERSAFLSQWASVDNFEKYDAFFNHLQAVARQKGVPLRTR